jgi:hypothetical protein
MKRVWAFVAVLTCLPSAASARSIEIPSEFRGQFVVNGGSCLDKNSAIGLMIGKDFIDNSESVIKIRALRKLPRNAIELDTETSAGSDRFSSTERLSLEKNGESLAIQRLTENGKPYQPGAPTYYGRCQ